MTRFLFVSLPLTGHVHPIAAVATHLQMQGHEVAWAGSESFLRPLVGATTAIYPIPLRVHRGQAERGMAAMKSRWDGYIVPHARVTRPGIDSAVMDFRPDVMAVDQHAVAGAVAAHRHGIRWASMAPTTMELTRPFRTLPRIESWIADRMRVIWSAAGLPGEPPHDLRFSPHRLIAFTSTALVAPNGDVPGNALLVGPALGPRPPDPDFPWQWIDPSRRTVLVTMGTLSMDLAQHLYQRIIEALRPLADRVQAIVVAPPGTIAEPPEHLLVRPRVPLLDVMPHLSAVISHGGLNTVCEALLHAVPLVVAPIKGDQPINANAVATAGAGVRVSFDHARPAALREALVAALENPAYRSAASRVRASFIDAGGAGAAATALTDLTASNPIASTPAVTPPLAVPPFESERVS